MPDVINALIKLFADDAKVYNRVKQNEQPVDNHDQSSFFSNFYFKLILQHEYIFHHPSIHFKVYKNPYEIYFCPNSYFY